MTGYTCVCMCACMHVSSFMTVYIYMRVHCMYVSMYICQVCIHLWCIYTYRSYTLEYLVASWYGMCVSESVLVHMYVCKCVYVYIYTHTHTNTYWRACIYAWADMYMHVSAPSDVRWLHGTISMYACRYIRICSCVYICVGIYACLYVYTNKPTGHHSRPLAAALISYR
jgi:hypothetical protein